jgi:hypothetical protein
MIHGVWFRVYGLWSMVHDICVRISGFRVEVLFFSCKNLGS